MLDALTRSRLNLSDLKAKHFFATKLYKEAAQDTVRLQDKPHPSTSCQRPLTTYRILMEEVCERWIDYNGNRSFQSVQRSNIAQIARKLCLRRSNARLESQYTSKQVCFFLTKSVFEGIGMRLQESFPQSPLAAYVAGNGISFQSTFNQQSVLESYDRLKKLLEKQRPKALLEDV